MSAGNGRGTRTGPGRISQSPGALVGNAVGVLLGVAVIGFLAAAPFTWALMLFLGNLGETHMDFWDCLPGGVLFGTLVAGKART